MKLIHVNKHGLEKTQVTALNINTQRSLVLAYTNATSLHFIAVYRYSVSSSLKFKTRFLRRTITMMLTKYSHLEELSGIGTGFCRMRNGRGRDEKITLPPDPTFQTKQNTKTKVVVKLKIKVDATYGDYCNKRNLSNFSQRLWRSYRS